MRSLGVILLDVSDRYSELTRRVSPLCPLIGHRATLKGRRKPNVTAEPYATCVADVLNAAQWRAPESFSSDTPSKIAPYKVEVLPSKGEERFLLRWPCRKELFRLRT